MNVYIIDDFKSNLIIGKFGKNSKLKIRKYYLNLKPLKMLKM